MSARLGAVVARGVRAETADRVLFEDLDLTVPTTARIGVVGANGAGKSTLLRILAGDAPPATGTVVRTPADLTVGVLPQEPERDAGETARAWVLRRTGVTAAEAEFLAAAEALGVESGPAVEHRYDVAFSTWTRLGCADADDRLAEVAHGLRLPARVLDEPTAHLSGGEAARVSLAALLLSRFEVLLLDEPTNNLDLDGLDRLEGFVSQFGGGLVIVSHDRAFLERTIRSVVDLTPDGVRHFDGGWQAYLAERERLHRLAVEAHEGYVDARDRLKGQAQTQREWADKGRLQAKRTRANEADKNIYQGKIQGVEKRHAAASRAEKALERLEVVEKPWEGWDLRFTIASADRAGARVLSWDEATVAFPNVTIGPFTEEIAWGERVHLAGPNGSGKSTLLAAALGRQQLTSGDAHLGPAVVVGEIGQQRDAIAGDPLRWLMDRSGLAISEARSLLAKFGVAAEHLARPVESWSTGERTRAHLALLQARGVNLVVLDEPTNHLDLEAIEQVEQALAEYDGTIVVVSHDRQFVEALAPSRTIEVRSGTLTA